MILNKSVKGNHLYTQRELKSENIRYDFTYKNTHIYIYI